MDPLLGLRSLHRLCREPFAKVALLSPLDTANITNTQKSRFQKRLVNVKNDDEKG